MNDQAKSRADQLATLYLEENRSDDLNRNAIHRFAQWLVDKKLTAKAEEWDG